ncbi:MAG: methyltransferase type 11, partial [Bacteroidota bacterium]|nr:methyltransferase type 11 [Bacteroidota bacterium]
IFKRDIEIFKTKYPDLKIVNIKHHTPFRYLISGGVSMKSIVPGWSFGFFTQLEKLLNPLSDQIGMFMTITIEKY